MKLIIILAALVVLVLLCDKYEKNLPPPINWIYALWKKFSHILGIVMTFIILTILWIVGFGIYAIIIKIITYPARYKREPTSYWIDSEVTTVKSMKHQF